MKITKLINKPCLTEKGMLLHEQKNQVVFEVALHANKIEIKKAIESLFNVKIIKVRTANMNGKKKRVGKNFGNTCDWKKAIVCLHPEQKLDFLEQL